MTTQPHDPSAQELAEMSVPRFCARCRRSYADYPRLTSCSACGEGLLPQGYCPVCETRWTLSPGESCPKHDVPLELQPETIEEQATEGRSTWVVAATFADDTEAEAKRLRLEAEGIPTRLENERMGSRSMLLVATGGITIKVPEASLADARVILSQAWTIPPSHDQVDADDEWEGLEPEQAPDRRRRVMKSIVWFMVAPSLIAFAFGMVALLVMLIYGLIGLFYR